MHACLVRDPASPPAPGALAALARACSPRVQPYGDDVVVWDARGLTRVIGTPREIAAEVAALAVKHGLSVRIALARTATTAWILAHAKPGQTVVEGDDGRALARLSLQWLSVLPDVDFGEPPKRTRRHARARHYRMAPAPGEPSAALPPPVEPAAPLTAPGSKTNPASPTLAGALVTFSRWGLATIGDVAALPRADLHARLGRLGVLLHQAASGDEIAPLIPSGEPPRFLERLQLDWPIDGLEPLSFVLARQCDALSLALERADRGAVAVTTRLQLVTRVAHVRTLNLPAPMREPRVLRTLILLDLESHPPPAAIDVVEVEVEVTPGRITQGSLLTRTLPAPEDLATLTARLGALMGESRIGAPMLRDSYDERQIAMKPFRIGPGVQAQGPRKTSGANDAAASAQRLGLGPVPLGLILRRFRLPVAVSVVMERGAPAKLSGARGLSGAVVASAGPWRTSGLWWAFDRSPWDRDEWDVGLGDGSVVRLARLRSAGTWEIEGVYD